MGTHPKYVLTSILALFGVLVFLSLTVYPFQYGPVESYVLAMALVLFGCFEIVLDDAFEG